MIEDLQIKIKENSENITQSINTFKKEKLDQKKILANS